jgi:hypothetical protein
MHRRDLLRYVLILATLAVLLPVAAGQARGPFLSFDVSGFTPNTHLQVYADGRCTLRLAGSGGSATSRHFVLKPPRLAALRAALESARWQSLRARYDARTSPGHEYVFYSITYAGRTVTASSAALEKNRVPQRLVRVLNLLDDVVRAHA